MSDEDATEQLRSAIAWWSELLSAHDVRDPDDAPDAAARIIAVLRADDEEDRAFANAAAQDLCAGYGDPTLTQPIPDEWWDTPLGDLVRGADRSEVDG